MWLELFACCVAFLLLVTLLVTLKPPLKMDGKINLPCGATHPKECGDSADKQV